MLGALRNEIVQWILSLIFSIDLLQDDVLDFEVDGIVHKQRDPIGSQLFIQVASLYYDLLILSTIEYVKKSLHDIHPSVDLAMALQDALQHRRHVI